MQLRRPVGVPSRNPRAAWGPRILREVRRFALVKAVRAKFRAVDSWISARQRRELYYILGALIGYSLAAIVSHRSVLSVMAFTAVTAWLIYTLLALRRGPTGAAAALPAVVFAITYSQARDWTFVDSTARNAIYATTGQVLPTLLIALAIQGSLFRVKSAFLRALALQVILVLAIGEAAALVGLNRSDKDSSGRKRPGRPRLAGQSASAAAAPNREPSRPPPAPARPPPRPPRSRRGRAGCRRRSG
jgi:hypothetical protein